MKNLTPMLIENSIKTLENSLKSYRDAAKLHDGTNPPDMHPYGPAASANMDSALKKMPEVRKLFDQIANQE